MSNLKLHIEGLDNIRRQFDVSERIQKIVPTISASILEFHNDLERRLSSVYEAPDNLTSVLIGKSIKPEAISRTLLRYSLQYRDKPVLLSKYPIQISASDSYSYAPTRNKRGKIWWKKGKYSKEYKVAIQKNKYAIKYGKKKLPAFMPGNTDLLVARLGETWKIRPSDSSEGERNPTELLFGPSIATLAGALYNNDTEIDKALTRMQNKIIAAYLNY